jgi:L-asparaginase/Glu-tRNA(Gln) amidotransferase subunit D
MCWRRSGALAKITRSKSTTPRKPKSPDLKVSTFEVCVLVTSRAMSLLTGALVAKRLEFMRQLVPAGTPIAYLMNPQAPESEFHLSYMQAAARDIGQQIVILNGIVIERLGWGNVNQPMFAAIKDALAKSVPVVIASRVPNGRVLPNYGWEGGGKTLVHAGAVMADDLSARKARILLMLLLQNGVNDQKGLQVAFSK